MEDCKSAKARDITKYYCLFYLVMTVLFLVCLPVAPAVPALAIAGAHAPYCILLFMLLISEIFYIPSGVIHGGIVLTAELLFLTALIVVSVMAFGKKKYFPFWVLTVCSNALTIITVILAFCLNGDGVVLSAFMLFSIIGNTIFSCLFYRKLHKKGKQ